MERIVKFNIIGLILALAFSITASAKNNALTAIDIALEPDAIMKAYAQQINKRLLKAYPEGFALDATHHPHITLVQCYVRTASLDKVYAAISKRLAEGNEGNKQLKAYQYNIYPWQGLGVAVVAIKPTAELFKLQHDLVKAVAPYTVKTGTAAAFYTTVDSPDINQSTINYVVKFIPEASGKNYHPHLTLGVATLAYLKTLLAQPVAEFTFIPAGVTIYQLGNYGTARKKLKTWG